MLDYRNFQKMHQKAIIIPHKTLICYGNRIMHSSELEYQWPNLSYSNLLRYQCVYLSHDWFCFINNNTLLESISSWNRECSAIGKTGEILRVFVIKHYCVEDATTCLESGVIGNEPEFVNLGGNFSKCDTLSRSSIIKCNNWKTQSGSIRILDRNVIPI